MGQTRQNNVGPGNLGRGNLGGSRSPEGHEPKAVQKALLLLEAVAHLGPGVTAKAIADHAKTPPATTYRLLNLLVSDGYLVRVDNLAGFALGRRTRELAISDSGTNGRPDGWAVTERLRHRLRHGVHLAAFDASQVRWVDLDPDHELLQARTMITQLHSSAVGKLLLAHRPEMLTGAWLTAVTARTVTDWSALLAQLVTIREREVATESGEVAPGQVALAVPIRNSQEVVTGCLCVTGRQGRLDPGDPVPIELLRSAATELHGWEATVPPQPITAGFGQCRPGGGSFSGRR